MKFNIIQKIAPFTNESNEEAYINIPDMTTSDKLEHTK